MPGAFSGIIKLIQRRGFGYIWYVISKVAVFKIMYAVFFLMPADKWRIIFKFVNIKLLYVICRRGLNPAYKRDMDLSKEHVIGSIDQEGRFFGFFGKLPFVKNVDKKNFTKRIRYDLDVVLIKKKILIRKGFRGDKEHFTLEWQALERLQSVNGVPDLYKVDINAHALYINFVPGDILRTVPSHNLSLELEGLLNKIHSMGVAGIGIKPGNIIIDARSKLPYFIDFEDAKVYKNTSDFIFLLCRNEDRKRFNRAFKRSIITEESARKKLKEQGLKLGGWHAPIDFGNGLTAGRFYSTDRGMGRWEFFNKDIVGPLVSGKRVLDLGSNNGVMPIMMLRSGAKEVTGIEIMPQYVESARLVHNIFEWRDMKKYNFNVYNYSMQEILYKDFGNFDVVTAFCSLYHLTRSDMAKFINKISKIAPVIVLQANTHSHKRDKDLSEKASVLFLERLLKDSGFETVNTYTSQGFTRPILVGKTCKVLRSILLSGDRRVCP